ncbi:hypothetical protein B0H14DRAFT_781197 [Mycena olivaceomarginata]|nr:hypothetical protein B0H14DRAFT_781197 [Mycena olivaceomarginata]
MKGSMMGAAGMMTRSRAAAACQSSLTPEVGGATKDRYAAPRTSARVDRCTPLRQAWELSDHPWMDLKGTGRVRVRPSTSFRSSIPPCCSRDRHIRQTTAPPHGRLAAQMSETFTLVWGRSVDSTGNAWRTRERCSHWGGVAAVAAPEQMTRRMALHEGAEAAAIGGRSSVSEDCANCCCGGARLGCNGAWGLTAVRSRRRRPSLS